MLVKIITLSSLHLFHISPPDQLGAEEEVLPVSLLQVIHQVSVSLLQIALQEHVEIGDGLLLLATYLVGVENYSLLCVILLHHLQGQAGDGWLEVSLLGINHHTDIQLLCSLGIFIDIIYLQEVISLPEIQCASCGACS